MGTARHGRRTKRSTLATLPSLIVERPPDAQIANARAMHAQWNDPDDNDPRRRTARTITGWRAFCPIRRRIARHGDRSRFTAEHVAAAEALRIAFDGSRLGFSALKDWRPVTDVLYRPPMGPTATALHQLECRETIGRVWVLFDDTDRAILAGVVLRNIPRNRCAEACGMRADACTDRLVAALDRLVLHFDIEREMQAGRVAA